MLRTDHQHAKTMQTAPKLGLGTGSVSHPLLSPAFPASWLDMSSVFLSWTGFPPFLFGFLGSLEQYFSAPVRALLTEEPSVGSACGMLSECNCEDCDDSTGWFSFKPETSATSFETTGPGSSAGTGQDFGPRLAAGRSSGLNCSTLRIGPEEDIWGLDRETQVKECPRYVRTRQNRGLRLVRYGESCRLGRRGDRRERQSTDGRGNELRSMALLGKERTTAREKQTLSRKER